MERAHLLWSVCLDTGSLGRRNLLGLGEVAGSCRLGLTVRVGESRLVGCRTLTSSRGPAGASLASGSCLPLASKMVMIELGMCAC